VRVTAPSACPWLDHSASGLIPVTERPVQTRFRCAYAYRLKLATETNSLTHYTKGTPSQARRIRRHDVPLRLLVGIRFQVYFTPLIGVLFTFPSRYLFAIGHQGVLRLGGWSPHVQTGLHVSRLTQGSNGFLPVRDSHPLRSPLPERSGSYHSTTGLVRVRSPLLAESRLMSVPPANEMFQFAGFASRTYEFSTGSPCGGVAPFGHPRINDRSHLPVAYRSVLRPSSPLGAKASTKCPLTLDLSHPIWPGARKHGFSRRNSSVSTSEPT
jgi:hypothetical protein